MDEPDTIENRTFDEIAVGDHASLTRTLSSQDLALFAALSGDMAPDDIDEDYARDGIQSRVVGHGMWGATIIANVLGTRLPGPGTLYTGADLRFVGPIGEGDTLTVDLVVREKQPADRTVVLDCAGINHLDQRVLEGTVRVIAPAEKIRRPRGQAPEVQLRRSGGYERLMAYCREEIEAVPVAVAHPCDRSSLGAAVEAGRRNLLVPILVGPEARIRGVAEEHDFDLSGLELIDAEHSHHAAALAVEQVRLGRAGVLMKGSLHTDELMEAVVDRAKGLRTERRISHAFIMDVATHSDVLIITDAAINIAPGLEAKRDICQNAIDLAHALGIEQPKVAILSAVETVTGRIPSTLDAAALCKMADRGQITGGLLDGPLAFDNAISPEAARIKNITSPVAGHANILVVPDLEAGNILAKQLTFLGKADAAGVVLGARVPIILTSRADSRRTKLASCAIAAIMARASREQLPKVPKGPNG